MQDIKSSKAARVDKLSARFLKDDAGILVKPVSAFCNLSIFWGVIPSVCKVAKLKPILKKDKKTDPSNYRPISLPPVISETTEKVVHGQKIAFLSDENILYNYQSGFVLFNKWNFKRVWQRFVNWNDFNRSSKSFWYNRLWNIASKTWSN